MSFLGDVVAWFTDASHWTGTAGIPNRVFEHLQLSVLAVVVGALIAIPAGVYLGHIRRGGLLAVSIVNIGRAIPSFAIMAVTLPIALRLGVSYGFWPTWIAVFLLGLPPMFTNAYTAVREVDPKVVDAARGMGLQERAVLLGIEVPLAAPVIGAGVRVATVQVIATAPLGALLGWGGLGRYIIDGLASYDTVQVFAGAVLVAVLCIGAEIVIGQLERLIVPAGTHRLNRAEAAVMGVKPGSATV